MLNTDTTTYRGFTLIELLVVVFIVSISASLLIVNISFDSSEDRIKQDATRLYSLLRFAHEQSVIRAEEYGVRFHQTGYRFMIYHEARWIELSSDKHLTSRELEEDMELNLFIEDIEDIEVTLKEAEDEAELMRQEQQQIDTDSADNSADKNKAEQKIKPQIFMLSSGELTPEFVARFRIPGNDFYYDVKGSLNGEYTLVAADE